MNFEEDPFTENETEVKIMSQRNWVAQELGSSDFHSDKEEQKKKAKFLIYGLIMIYVVIITLFFVSFSLYPAFRMKMFDLMERARDRDNMGHLILASFGSLSILLGFDIFVYDILIGYLLKPYWYALAFVATIKIVTKYFMFVLARYCFKSFIYSLMRDNIYFITLYIATKRKPVKILILLQFLALPTVFKTYAIGLFKITHWQYFSVTFVSNLLWSMFWVYLGSSIGDIMDYLETGSTNVFIPWWLSVIMSLISVAVIVYLGFFTADVYKNIEQEAIKAIQ